MRGAKYIRDKADEMNYKEVIKHALTKSSAKYDDQHNLLLAIHLKVVNEQKLLRNSGLLSNCNGNGRTSHMGSQIDKYVLTRKNNIPELIFN